MSKYINYFWKYLESKNITDIFGLPGGAFSDNLSKKPTSIYWNNVGDELQNGFIASVYGYYKKNVGILFTTTGPGIATLLSAYVNAKVENLPLLVISTFNPLTDSDFQWWNIKQIGSTIGHLFYIETIDEFIKKLHQAYYLARQNTGVILLININILNQPDEIPDQIYNQIVDNKLKISKNKIVSTINRKFCNKRSLIVIGKGLFFNYDVLKQFILRNNLPYVTTWKQRYIIENGLYCGRLGSLGNHSANYAVIKASRILVIGDISEGLNTPFFSNKFTFRKLNKKALFIY
jgi:thiamine pyrophosphate-dependent acetolactate synthase large subunit-like protein